MFIVSACLLGFRTRFDGTEARLDDRQREKMMRLLLEGKAVPICPEQLGGLPTPRAKIEFRGGDGDALLDGISRAYSEEGLDCSNILKNGAQEVLRIAQLYGIKRAILKDGSPSCGVTYVYIDGKRASGIGVTTSVLRRSGIEVATIDSL